MSFHFLLPLLVCLSLSLGRRPHQQGLRAPHVSKNSVLPTEQWFRQRRDHFRATEGRTWRQRFWVSRQFYKEGGPTLLMVGGEGEANPSWLVAGSWLSYAEATGAALVLLEHRYYGKSRPTKDLGVKNMAWLSSRQALADLAAFTTVMQKEGAQDGGGPLDGPWVVLGGSYPGSLAAWFRLKYPHLVVGAIASSAPLIAKADFFEYLEVVGQSLDSESPGCSALVQEGLEVTTDLAKRRIGWLKLKKMFNLCSDFNGLNWSDITNFYEALLGNFEGVVQYNRDNRAWEGAKWTNITINTLCDIMNQGGEPLDNLAQVNALSLKMEGEKCLDHTYKSEISELQNSSWDSPAANGGRQWTYQTCTEFGWYQSSDIPRRPWGNLVPAKFFEKMCSDIYGPKFTIDLLKKGITETNREYGGLDLSATNVVFVQGTVDPWHAVGRVSSSDSLSPAILIPGSAHCADMYPACEGDSAQLKEAREKIKTKIVEWLGQEG